jgi:hypothetical protein
MYTINVENYMKDEGWDFGIYTKYNSDPGVANLAWQVLPTSPGTDISPYHTSTSWPMSFFVSLSYVSQDGIWHASTSLPAELGNDYLVEKDTSSGALQIVPGPKNEQPNVVKLISNVDQSLNLGFGIKEDLAAVVGTKHASENAEFNVHPTYYVGIYRNLVVGQNITSAESASVTQKVTFTDNNYTATLAVKLVSGKTTLQPPVYSK